jgi:hypothetical protein
VNDAVEAIETALLDGAPLHIDDTNERVGIGTTSPSAPLEINGSRDTELLRLSAPLNAANQTNYITMVDSQDGGIVAAIGLGSDVGGANDNDGGIAFRTTTAANTSIPATRMYINKDGDVGIGTTSMTNQFTVYNGTYYSIIGRNDWGLRSPGTYALSTSNAANVYISSNGTFYRSTSSAKYKTDVEDIDTSAADVVFALRPVWFRSTSPHDPEGWSYYGLIAEEVAEVDPRLVSFGAGEDCGCDFDADHVAECLTEPEGVYYDRLVPHLISVVQRQQEQIDALTARIEALEAV